MKTMELIAVQEYWKAFNDNKLLGNNKFTENQKNTSDICKWKTTKQENKFMNKLKASLGTHDRKEKWQE